MTVEANKLRQIIRLMQDAYAQGKNVMSVAREFFGQEANDPVAILIAYDLQSGAYNEARRNS